MMRGNVQDNVFTTHILVRRKRFVVIPRRFVCSTALLLGLGFFLESQANSDYSDAKPADSDYQHVVPSESQGGLFERPDFRIDAGYTHDDNVSRADRSRDRLSDQIYSLKLSTSLNVPLGSNTRLRLDGFLGGEKFNTYTDLGRVSGGGQAEFQYRSSGNFGAPIFGVFARASAERFQSDLRDGFRYSSGITLRQPLTDRINLFGSLAYNVRQAREKTFDSRDASALLNLDYAAIANSTLYLTAEYRRGDMVSSGPPSLESIDLATAVVEDDVFDRQGFLDYRFKARTLLTTVGYNLPFGPSHSADLSWRRAESDPTDSLSFAGRKPRYVDNQISIVYLMRF
jgi:hypothetical protein